MTIDRCWADRADPYDGEMKACDRSNVSASALGLCPMHHADITGVALLEQLDRPRSPLALTAIG